MATSDITSAGATTGFFSWSRLVIRAAIVLLLFIAANLITYYSSGFFQREQLYVDEVAQLAARPGVRVIFAGDSHFAVPLNDYLNLNPANPAYSIAYGGDSLRECFAKVRRALQTNPGIDTLILTADPHMFGKGRLDSSNRSFADRYFITALDRSGLPKNLWSAVLQEVPLFNEDFLQYFRKELGVMLAHSAPHARGEGDPLAWSRLSEEQRTRAATETGKGDHEGVGTLPQPFFWYRRTVELAQARHVRVIGVRFPVNSAYAAQAPANEVARIDAFIRAAGVERILDLRAAVTDPRDFEDEDHLNETGAAVMVQRLQQELQRPLLAR
jgi:hypothetical protein